MSPSKISHFHAAVPCAMDLSCLEFGNARTLLLTTISLSEFDKIELSH
jgi:hypothetical protein